MTSDAKELSNYDGQPVILYDFFRVSTPTLTGVPVTTHWRYTSADRDYTFGSDTFKAIAISDDGIRQSGDATADQLTITMPASEAVPQMFVGSPPSDPISLLVYRVHNGETDRFLEWAGVIGMSHRAEDELQASIACNTVAASMDRQGVRLSWGRGCPHSLYDSECTVNPASFYVTGAVSALTGDSVTATAIGTVPNGRLNGGFVEWIDGDGNAERRGCVQHVGTTVRILGTTDRLAVGTTIYVFFGCDHTPGETFGCLSFANGDNYGGHLYVPTTNPFSGDNIF